MTQRADTKTGHYYVSVIDSGRTALALGPFTNDHAGALARIDDVRRLCEERDPFAAFWAYGTARLPLDADAPEGKLNAELMAA
jgi:hypothetical protein